MSNVRTSASIPSKQFMDGGVSLYGIYIGVIVLGSLHFALMLYTPCCVLTSVSEKEYKNCYLIFSLFISNFIFNLIEEALFFKFVSCFNFRNNGFVIARSSLVILRQAILLFLGLLIPIIKIKIYLKKSKRDEIASLLWPICMIFFFVIPSFVMIVLNLVLLARLKPQLNNNIEPSSIRMGFFNSTEINSIQMGTYVKTETFSQQIIGNLSDILFSSKRVFNHKSKSRSGSSLVYFKQYLYQINCTNQSQLFFKDCFYSSNLTMDIRYDDYNLFEDRYLYPTYNCLSDKPNQKCASNCTQLLSNYTLILIQDFDNKVEAAWYGLSNCNQPNIKLTHNSSIYTCSIKLNGSNSIKLNGTFYSR